MYNSYNYFLNKVLYLFKKLITINSLLKFNYYKLFKILITVNFISGNYHFTCCHQKTNITTDGNVSGINITNWKEHAIIFDKDQTVEGEVTVSENITFTQTVSGAKSLGVTDLEELLNSVQQNILDTHQNMKVILVTKNSTRYCQFIKLYNILILFFKDNLTEECEETDRLLQKAREQDRTIQYFEQSQIIDSSENSIHSVYHFQVVCLLVRYKCINYPLIFYM